MKNCEQTAGQSVLDHGNSAWEYTEKILNKNLSDLKVPKWLENNHDKILKNILPKDKIKLYNVYHDCGKPYCLEVDNEGKRHFPNHAAVSKNIWLSAGGDSDVADLIGLDMVLHVNTAEEIENLKLSKEQFFTLLITALSEIHSNANLFGGRESISFKSKWKKIDRRGNMLVGRFFQ